MIDYGNFSKALKNLELQHDNYKNLDDELPELMKEAVAESVIQRFKTCYDCLWKVLKRYLTEELGIPDVPNSPKPILKLADENDLFVTPLNNGWRMQRLGLIPRMTIAAKKRKPVWRS